MTLSILICTMPKRAKLLHRLTSELNRQITERGKGDVEVLTNDTERFTTGAKRNSLVANASGQYVAFIDDDDLVPSYYIKRIFDVLDNERNIQAIGFQGELIHMPNRSPVERFRHSVETRAWQTRQGSGGNLYLRNITHINVVSRQIMLEVPFPDTSQSEDFIQSMALQNSKKLQRHFCRYISETMYLYEFWNDKKHFERYYGIAEGYAQCGQDVYIRDYFAGKPVGLIVEVGAHDGKSLSNSLLLEEIGWDAILIEANPKFEEKLLENRPKAVIHMVAAAEQDGQAIFVDAHDDFLGGIQGDYPEAHAKRVAEAGGGAEIIVPARRLADIFNESNVKHVDAMTIDVEGAELSVLKGIDFDRVSIDMIIVENNYRTNDVNDYLTPKGYELLTTLDHDDVFVVTNKAPKAPHELREKKGKKERRQNE